MSNNQSPLAFARGMTMRKLIVDEWVSLDGFAARPDGSLDFFGGSDFSKQADDDMHAFMQGIDTILLGSNTYKMFVDYWPTVSTAKEPMADIVNSTPKLVFSKSLAEAPWGKWAPARVVSGNVEEGVRELKKLSGKDMVLWGSLSIARVLLKAQLIDRMLLRVCPVAIGQGKSFYPPDVPSLKVRLRSQKRYDPAAIVLEYDLVSSR
jgi:dihydrofolate reductase